MMPVGAILTVAELKELTGCRQRKAMIRRLASNRIPYVIAADGWPRVHQDALLGQNVVPLRPKGETEPDYDAA